ncbi:hypothetical protein AB0I10_08635 [Streptomyces sp. NPDC050636]|uniref:hypothetical protein n=1 Tax=Streptomyces sp. NPDC050636 TaxID=3154510 RepID=UPI003442FB41
MTDVERTTMRASLRETWRKWPRWVGPATLCWAVVQGGLALVWALAGRPLADRGAAPRPAAADMSRPTADWFVFAVTVLAAVAVPAAARYRERPAVRALPWVACGLSVASAFGLLMDVLGLLLGQGVDSPPAAVQHALGLLGAVLLAATARSHRSAACGRCGGAHEKVIRPAPSAAPRRVHLFAYAGTLAFLPYAAMKVTWATGGAFAGVSSAEMHADSERNGASGLWLTLDSWGLDPTALLAALGVFLLFGLIRPWGQVFPRWTLILRDRRVPRWLPLTPALIGTATLVPYGVLGSGYLALATAGALPVRRGDFHSDADVLLVGWIGATAFALYGVALLVAARSYWLRTRPVCPPR